MTEHFDTASPLNAVPKRPLKVFCVIFQQRYVMKQKASQKLTGFSLTPSPNPSASHPKFSPQAFFPLSSSARRPIA
jgi:hypothetical protein